MHHLPEADSNLAATIPFGCPGALFDRRNYKVISHLAALDTGQHPAKLTGAVEG
jgi:hypothetical protein